MDTACPRAILLIVMSQNQPRDSERSPEPAGDERPAAVEPLSFDAAARVRAMVGLVLPVFEPAPMKPLAVRYEAREGREGGIWQVAAPELCWQCGSVEGLKARPLEVTARLFEPPLGWLLALAAATVVLVLAGLFWGSTSVFVAGVVAAVVGVALLALAGSSEEVRLRIFCCARHASGHEAPAAFVHDNQLVLYFPYVAMAEKAREELTVRRRGKGRYIERDESPAARGGTAPARGGRTEETPASESAPPASRAPRAPLPKIKLDGDE